MESTALLLITLLIGDLEHKTTRFFFISYKVLKRACGSTFFLSCDKVIINWLTLVLNKYPFSIGGSRNADTNSDFMRLDNFFENVEAIVRFCVPMSFEADD